MELPSNLKAAIDKEIEGFNQDHFIQIANMISRKYRTESGSGKRLITNDDEALVYSIVRMPATYCAVVASLEYILELTEYKPKKVLDVGAGTGAASWGASFLLDLEQITCLEREESMIQLGKKLMANGSDKMLQTIWEKFDLASQKLTYKSDLVIASYVLSELTEVNRLQVIEDLWNATNGILLIIEPGTPEGFRQLKIARELLLNKGAKIIAPCPHEKLCPMSGDDWCHFTCRVARTKLHRILKEGDAPYEDEKFSYVAFTRYSYKSFGARILRHPYIEKGRVTLRVCAKDGDKSIIISKRDGELYKFARKAKSGDQFVL